RRLDLNFLALTQILQPVIFVGLALFLLVEGYGAVGVAWANVAATVVVVLVVWLRLWLQGLPRWHGWPSLSIWREAMAGSFKMFVGGFGGYLGGRIDNLVVTAAIGPLAMSFYSMAWNASRMPANVFASAINFVFIPTLARIQGDPERVDRGFRECLKHSYLLLAPVCAVLFVSSPLIVTFVLGAKWLPLIPALRVMCFTVLFGPLIFACGALLTGTGRAHLVGIATIVQIVVLLVSIPFLANRWGVVGAAYGDLLAVVALTVVLCATVKVVTRQLNRALFATFTVPVVAAISGGLAAWNLGAHISTDALRLIVECVLTLTVYLLVVLVLGGRARLFDLTTLLRGIVRRSPLVSAQ
ncbi:MAG TPA: oligosaccharide flippase family protein, partial [Blastocatellia bacterium]|nr:oligosaccharide flippase family protein [Blastocatellia bacterium]